MTCSQTNGDAALLLGSHCDGFAGRRCIEWYLLVLVVVRRLIEMCVKRIVDARTYSARPYPKAWHSELLSAERAIILEVSLLVCLFL